MAVPNPAIAAHTAIVIGPGLSPLEGARIDVAINDLLAEFTLMQQFRNATAHDIEAVFTFPIPMDAVFLGLSATLGERELEGRVIERQKAAREYEEAIASGDSAVLVERTRDGMLSANIGNLKVGETIKVRLRFAQWLSFNGQQVRFRMPTTIAPRYGQPQMNPRDQPVTDLLAQYKFAAEIRVNGLLAAAELSSPSHLLAIRRDGEAVVLTLKTAWMDRDFALDANFDRANRCSAMCAPDGDGDIVTLAIAADLAGRQESLDVSLVVDCSGSMGGVGIHYARLALKEIIRSLAPSDQVNLVRFGSSNEKMFKQPVAMDTPMRSRLEEHVVALEANMGGTELIAALETAASDLATTDARNERSRVMFVITDGEIQETKLEVLKRICSTAGIRIFCVGVGGAVAEDTLRAISDATSGAVEIVQQNEEMAARIVRHFERVRAPAARITDVKWPGNPVWSHVPKTFLSGDTIRCFARFAKRVDGDVEVHWQAAKAGQVRMSIRREPTRDLISTSARMAAAQQLDSLESRSKRVELAVRYQLLTDVTSAILVAPRVAGDKAGDTPEIVRVPQMMAAGWGGLAAACAAPRAHSVDDLGVCYSMEFSASEDFDTPAFLRRESSSSTTLGSGAEQPDTRTPSENCWRREHVEAMLRWMEGEFAYVLASPAETDEALTALLSCWQQSDTGRWPILRVLFVRCSVTDHVNFLAGVLGLMNLLSLSDRHRAAFASIQHLRIHLRVDDQSVARWTFDDITLV